MPASTLPECRVTGCKHSDCNIRVAEDGSHIWVSLSQSPEGGQAGSLEVLSVSAGAGCWLRYNQCNCYSAHNVIAWCWLLNLLGIVQACAVFGDLMFCSELAAGSRYRCRQLSTWDHTQLDSFDVLYLPSDDGTPTLQQLHTCRLSMASLIVTKSSRSPRSIGMSNDSTVIKIRDCIHAIRKADKWRF